jgi:phage shock protein E
MLRFLRLAILLMVPAVAAAQPVVIQFIKVVEVHGLIARGSPPVLVDVRSREEYAARHIAGAVSIPVNEITRHAREIPRYPLVVLY